MWGLPHFSCHINNKFVMCSRSVSILHICTAKGLRECAFAAAEKLKKDGRLDTKEHKGKVCKNLTLVVFLA